MPSQLFKNKVEYFGQTLIDLTEDTVTPETLRSGVTAHDASGAPIVGTRNNDTISFHDNDMIVEPGTNRITFDGSDMIIHPPDGAAWLERTMEALEGGVAIISTNNEHAAISNGQYVYIRMHTSLPDGLYKATTDIAQNAELSASNVTSASGTLNEKSDVGHTHDDRYYTETEVDTALNGKANSSHTHDDRYYTESEVDSALNGKSDTSHTHNSIVGSNSTAHTLGMGWAGDITAPDWFCAWGPQTGYSQVVRAISTANAKKRLSSALPSIKKITRNIGDVTIGSGGYQSVASFKPADPSGYTFLFCAMWDWGFTSNSNTAHGINASGNFMYGGANSKITSVVIAYFYILTENMTSQTM